MSAERKGEGQNFYVSRARVDHLARLSQEDGKKTTDVLQDAIDFYARMRRRGSSITCVEETT